MLLCNQGLLCLNTFEKIDLHGIDGCAVFMHIMYDASDSASWWRHGHVLQP